jgi:excisionase family DNA binding protein
MSDWLSLAEAAQQLGVHPSTLRRWSDEGRIVSVRTEGGHRRFERAVIERHLAEHNNPALPTKQLQATPPAWVHTFQGESLTEVRQLGQRLLGLMLQYVTRQNEDERFLAEGRLVGRGYGKETAEADLAMLHMVEAFLYFRSHFTEMTIHLPTFPRPGDDAEVRRLHGRMDRFMNEVLLGAIEGYEQHSNQTIIRGNNFA